MRPNRKRSVNLKFLPETPSGKRKQRAILVASVQSSDAKSFGLRLKRPAFAFPAFASGIVKGPHRLRRRDRGGIAPHFLVRRRYSHVHCSICARRCQQKESSGQESGCGLCLSGSHFPGFFKKDSPAFTHFFVDFISRLCYNRTINCKPRDFPQKKERCYRQ